MEFYVNSEKIDIELENEKTIGDVLRSFEEECEKNNATTIKITLNENTVNADQFDEICKKPIAEETKLEFVTISQADIQNMFLQEASDCESLAEKIQELPGKLQAGKDKEANNLITVLADLIGRFCHTASLSALFPDIYGNLQIDGKPLGEFFSDFLQILNDFEGALNSKDTVLIGDLAEYEISPRLKAIADSIKDL